MAQWPVTVNPVPGYVRHEGRALAFLVVEGRDDVNVWPVLKRFDTSNHRSVIEERNAVVARFRDWFKGGKPCRYHHGWTRDKDPDFTMGYVFRWDDPQGQHRRLYGFLTNPRPHLEVCVLCRYAAKDTHLTDKEIKELVRSMSRHPDVNAAVKRAFGRDRRERQARWNTH